jgi:hypothetical protein
MESDLDLIPRRDDEVASRRQVFFMPRSIFIAIASVATIFAAFLRGNYLLGVGAGIAYMFVVLGLILLVASARSRRMVSVYLVLALIAISILANPAWFNHDLQHFINDQATDRNVRADLYRLFDSDPAFQQLSVSTLHLKVVNFTIHGTLPTKSDFDRLRKLLENENLVPGPLHWNIYICDTGDYIEGLDYELFPRRTKPA